MAHPRTKGIQMNATMTLDNPSSKYIYIVKQDNGSDSGIMLLAMVRGQLNVKAIIASHWEPMFLDGKIEGEQDQVVSAVATMCDILIRMA